MVDDPLTVSRYHFMLRRGLLMAIDEAMLSKSTYFGKWTVRGRAMLR